MRTFVIGDIHGNIKALNQVLAQIPLKDGDKLIFLGDYGDGHSGTSEVVDGLLKLKVDYECVFLLGNHDIWVRDWINYGKKPDIWTQQGGQATLDSYLESGKQLDMEHRKFWNSLELYHHDEHNNLYVHGGWDSRAGSFLEASKRTLSNLHPEVVWDRTLAEFRLGDYAKEFNKIFIGHSQTGGFPESFGNVWNVDTGAGWTGRLTAMDVDTQAYWQSVGNIFNGRTGEKL
jgi:serine/threonine protein phosphatase 1